MKICISQLRYFFREYNKKYFNGILPMPFFEIIHTHKIFGRFECYTNRHSCTEPVIKMSDGFEYTDEQLRDVLVHEMIHFYLAYTGKDRKVTHGKKFKQMMNEMNETYNLNIMIEYNGNDFYKFEIDNPFKKTIKKLLGIS